MQGNNTSPALSPGTELKDYTICGVLGQDVYGYTYSAVGGKDGGRVVIREHLPCGIAIRCDAGAQVLPLSADARVRFETALESFHDEAEKACNLDHPNIVKVTDVFFLNGTAYYAMLCEQGVPLAEWASRGLEQDSLVALLQKLLFALSYMHGHHFLHLNIKPSNILIRQDGEPVFIGFGGARRKMQSGADSSEFAGYKAYELVHSGDAVGAWTDIYALGATLYRILSGQCPPESFLRVLDDTLQPLVGRRRVVSRYGRNMAACVDKALSIPAGRRWLSAFDWMEALENGTFAGAAEEGLPESADTLFIHGEEYFYGHVVGKDETRAVEYYRLAAEAGYLPAQEKLAWCYYNGKGVGQDFKEAVRWYLKALGQESVFAMNNLGLCYENGQGVTQDLEKAASLYREAAETGDPVAQCNFACCCENGRGVPQSYGDFQLLPSIRQIPICRAVPRILSSTD